MTDAECAANAGEARMRASVCSLMLALAVVPLGSREQSVICLLPGVVRVLHDLGYERVVGIVDGNRLDQMEKLKTEFTEYHFVAIPTDDVRDKKARQIKEAHGLCDRAGRIHPEHEETVRRMFKALNGKLCD